MRIDERISLRNLAKGDSIFKNTAGGTPVYSIDSSLAIEISNSEANVVIQDATSIDGEDSEPSDHYADIATILAANMAAEQYQVGYGSINFVFSFQGLALITISIGRSDAARRLARSSQVRILVSLFNPEKISAQIRFLIIVVELLSIAAIASFLGPIMSEAAADTNDAAIAYRSNTGTDGMDAPKYRERNIVTGAWGPELELTTTSESNVRFAWLEFSPVSSKRVMVILHDDGTLDSFMCEGACATESSWIKQQNIVDLWTVAPGGADRPFDMAFEESSGDLILVYDKVSTSLGQELFYRVMTNTETSFGSETPIDTQTGNSATDRVYPFIRLAADDGNDKIGAIMLDTSNDDVNAMIWNGSAWGDNVSVTTASANIDEEQIGIAWERNSGHLLAVGGAGGNIAYVEYTTSWQTPSSLINGVASGVGNVNWISMKQSPRAAGNEIYLAFSGDASDFASIQWSGTTWGTGTEHDVDIDSHAARAFDIAMSGDADGSGATVDAMLAWGHSTSAPAFDAVSNVAAGTGNLSWTHTPVGTPRAVIVFIVQTGAGTDQVTSVTYGGTSMTEVSGSPNLHAAGETGAVYAYFLGSAIPTGAQTVTVNVSGAASKRAVAYTLTANADTEIVDSDGTINSSFLSNPSRTLSLSGRTSWAGIGFYSGQNAVGSITPLGSWTGDLEHSFGGIQVAGWYQFNTIGSSDVTAGWTQAADDAVMIGVAVSEVQSITYRTWTASNTYGAIATLSNANLHPWIQFAQRPNPTVGDTLDNLGGTLDGTFDISRLQWTGGSNAPTNTDDEVTTDTTVTTWESLKVAFQRQPDAKRTMSEQLVLLDTINISLTKSMSEQMTITENHQRSIIASRSLLDQMTVTDTVVKTLSVTLVEQLAMTDSTIGNLMASRSIVEQMSAADKITVTMSMSLSEQLGVTDDIQSSKMYARAMDEQFAITESIGMAMSTFVIEQLGITDFTAIAAAYSVSLVEQLGIADNAVMTSAYSVSITEQLGMTDAVSKTILQSTFLLEQMGVTDDLQISTSTNRSLSDQFGLADGIAAGSGISANIAVSLTMNDAITSSVVTTRAIFDNLAVTDSVSGSPVIVIAIIDTMSLQDQFTDISAIFNLSLIQSLALAQGFATDFTGIFDQVDNEGITIGDSVVLSLGPIPSESMALQDQVVASLKPAEVEDDDKPDDRPDNTTSRTRTDHIKRLIESMLITDTTSTQGRGGQAAVRNIADSLALSTDQMKPLHQRVITIQNVTVAVNIENVQPMGFGGAGATLNLDIMNKNGEIENLVLRYTYSDPATGKALHTGEQTIAIAPGTSNVRSIQVPFYSEGTYDLMVEVQSSDGTLASTDIVVSVPWLPVYLYILVAMATVVITASISFVFFSLRRSLLW
jgi:hypothetical protein